MGHPKGLNTALQAEQIRRFRSVNTYKSANRYDQWDIELFKLRKLCAISTDKSTRLIWSRIGMLD